MIKAVIFLILIISTSCSDNGQDIRKANPDLDSIVSLITSNKDTENLYYRHGMNICYGYWTYELYKECMHPFHGPDGNPDVLEYAYAQVTSGSAEQAYVECGESLAEGDKIPMGAIPLSYRVYEAQPGFFQCIATIEIPKYKRQRSKVCGSDYELGLQIKEELGHSREALLSLGGVHSEECFTCDHINLSSVQEVQDKYFCLMGNYLKIGSLGQVTNEYLLMKQEMITVMQMFLPSYRFVLLDEQVKAMEKILENQ